MEKLFLFSFFFVIIIEKKKNKTDPFFKNSFFKAMFSCFLQLVICKVDGGAQLVITGAVLKKC